MPLDAMRNPKRTHGEWVLLVDIMHINIPWYLFIEDRSYFQLWCPAMNRDTGNLYILRLTVVVQALATPSVTAEFVPFLSISSAFLLHLAQFVLVYCFYLVICSSWWTRLAVCQVLFMHEERRRDEMCGLFSLSVLILLYDYLNDCLETKLE